MSRTIDVVAPDPHTGPPYPGLGLPLRIELGHGQDCYPIGAHGSCRGAHTDLLPVRELAMMHIMDRLSDKPDWHKKVWDENIVTKWRAEAKAIPDIEHWYLSTKGKMKREDEENEQREREQAEAYGEEYRPYWYFRCKLEGIINDNTFDCIIQELRSKAKYFEDTGIVVTMDAAASVAKSDTLLSSELHEDLSNAFRQLISDQSVHPDWHPNSNDMVQDLVHPSMYPFIFGRSRVFEHEVVGIDKAISTWSGKGTIIEKDVWKYDKKRDQYSYGVGGDIHPNYWNDTYQWLPANVSFQDDDSVKFTSYINNLHPEKYRAMYHTIEKLIETALPMWDQCLRVDSYDGDGDAPEVTRRRGSRFPYPDESEANDYNPENWIPSDPEEVADIEVNWDEVRSWEFRQADHDDDLGKKWEFLKKAHIPGVAFEDVVYTPKVDQRLISKFRETGLQIIVKMASIELTPEKPDFPAGGWHVEGQLNEHICATALYYVDCENVTSSSLSFRMQTDAYMNDDYSVDQQAYSWLEQIWGTELGDAPCLQNYGSVETRQGRLLAFPNVFQHRVSPFSLVDRTKPGHRRFIALWLVDPHQRIISTANVPPQQQDWWLDSVLQDPKESDDKDIASLMRESTLNATSASSQQGKLPPELMDEVWQHFTDSRDKGLLSEEEAKEHRLELMKMRTAHVIESEDMWHAHGYSFCEH